MSRQSQSRVISICNQCAQRVKGACSQGHLAHEGERCNQCRLPGGGTTIPHEGKLGKRRVEAVGEIDGTDDESSMYKGLEFQESMK